METQAGARVRRKTKYREFEQDVSKHGQDKIGKTSRVLSPPKGLGSRNRLGPRDGKGSPDDQPARRRAHGNKERAPAVSNTLGKSATS